LSKPFPTGRFAQLSQNPDVKRGGPIQADFGQSILRGGCRSRPKRITPGRDGGRTAAASMADAKGDREEQHATAVQHRYLLRFEEDTLKSRPL
jgi:hypothetical protein